MTKLKRGKLIVFEGGEYAGKTTQLKILAEKLRQEGYSVVETKEPGCATEKCQAIRKILVDPNKNISPEEELDLFIKDREDHFKKIVIPALRSGKIVLCDRCSPSTISYQHYGRGLDITDILVKDAKARHNIGFDLVILLDIDPVVAASRRSAESRFELENMEFHQKVRNGYLEQARHDPEHWLVIDATKPTEVVSEEIWKRVASIFSRQNKHERE
jgi:dTMP kinase